MIERYDNFDELTPTIINEFVEKILIHKRDRKGSQTANQKVEIYFNFIGNYELPKEELSEEEMIRRRLGACRRGRHNTPCDMRPLLRRYGHPIGSGS